MCNFSITQEETRRAMIDNHCNLDHCSWLLSISHCSCRTGIFGPLQNVGHSSELRDIMLIPSILPLAEPSAPTSPQWDADFLYPHNLKEECQSSRNIWVVQWTNPTLLLFLWRSPAVALRNSGYVPGPALSSLWLIHISPWKAWFCSIYACWV